MYNGIGIQTPRGTGTNGYVQRNMGALPPHKRKVDYKVKPMEEPIRNPNADLLEHKRKRRVELKCLEMRELMQEQG